MCLFKYFTFTVKVRLSDKIINSQLSRLLCKSIDVHTRLNYLFKVQKRKFYPSQQHKNLINEFCLHFILSEKRIMCSGLCNLTQCELYKNKRIKVIFTAINEFLYLSSEYNGRVYHRVLRKFKFN